MTRHCFLCGRSVYFGRCWFCFPPILLLALALVGCNGTGYCDRGAECGMWSASKQTCSCRGPGRLVAEPVEGDPTTLLMMCRCPHGKDGGK